MSPAVKRAGSTALASTAPVAALIRHAARKSPIQTESPGPAATDTAETSPGGGRSTDRTTASVRVLTSRTTSADDLLPGGRNSRNTHGVPDAMAMPFPANAGPLRTEPVASTVLLSR